MQIQESFSGAYISTVYEPLPLLQDGHLKVVFASKA